MRRVWWCAGLLLIACGHPGPATPSPPPLPEPGEPPSSGDGTRGWSFEAGLEGWRIERGTLAPNCDPVSAERLAAASGRPLVSLNPPGDYWQTPIDVGADGRCRIDTGAPARTPLTLLSPDFLLDEPYVAFRLGGGGTPGARVELQLAAQGYAPAFSANGPGTLPLAEVAWDVRALRGQAARFAILDDGVAPHGILADAFRAESSARPRPAPLWGFADVHAHPLGQLGFGRHVLYGASDGPIEQALAACDAEHGHGGAGIGGRAGPLMAFFEASFDGHPGHHTRGYPTFEGWPRQTTTGHQQMYIDWIRRAWQGGLRLLVAHVVNNEELATYFNGQRPFDDVSVALSVLDATRELAARHADFMAVALTPQAAREIIASGRLALVLGVEVDSLGNCRRDTDCSEAQARAAIDQLWEHGARHVFPIHLADNAFGGAAIFRDGLFNQLSWFLRDEFQTVEADDGVVFSFNDEPQALPEWLARLPLFKNLYGKIALYPRYAHVRGGHVNARGLTPLGRAAIAHMFHKGMLVDIDHMSQKARAEALALARARRAPLAMGHSWFRELAYTRGQTDDNYKLKHEGMKTAAEVEAVRALGGVVAPMLNQNDLRRDAASGILSECAGSSSAWLQAYAYAVRRMGETGVGLATDVNGLAQGTLPRFGPLACLARAKAGGGADGRRQAPGMDMAQTLRADADSQTDGVSYATPPSVARKSRFQTAQKSQPYDAGEVTLWIALVAAQTGEPASALGLSASEQAVVDDVRRGLADQSARAGSSWRAAAFLVKSGAPAPSSPPLLRQRYRALLPIFQAFVKSGSGNLSAPLERNLAGTRDFDYNFDGLAHYGLVPDFLQDASNQLRRSNGSVRDLSSLFRSAESYLRTWERAVESGESGL